MITLLLLGFLIGMRHALEADHLAAVATLTARSPNRRQALKLGIVWGLGHTITLSVFAGLVLVVDGAVPRNVAEALELGVGFMLIVLGVDLVRRIVRKRVHFHAHSHADGVTHFHAHSHANEKLHDPSRHRHEHAQGFPVRALLVGLVHGMAGSAALIMLTLDSAQSTWHGVLYIVLFGAGSILGMGLLSVIIAIPLSYSARRLSYTHNALQLLVGTGTIGLGLMLIYRNELSAPLRAVIGS